MRGYEEIERRMIEVAQMNPVEYRYSFAATVAGVPFLDYMGNPHWSSKAKITTAIKERILKDSSVIEAIKAKLRENGETRSLEPEYSWHRNSYAVAEKFELLYKDLVKRGIIRTFKVNNINESPLNKVSNE